jgi:beta-glucosidase/6-phospho-beta-glucosidase/beta-galactosidase
MDSLIKTIPQIQQCIKDTMKDFREAQDSAPVYDYSLFTPEAIADMRKDYKEKIFSRAKESLKDVASDVQIKKKLLQDNINKLRFPVKSSAVGSDEKMTAEITQSRAEALAMSKLDYNVISYLKAEFQKGNTDFINYFEDAVKLNTGLSTDLRSEMSEVFSAVSEQTGLKDLQTEISICSVHEDYINTYDKVIKDNDPALKLQLGYIQDEIKNLTGAEV